MNKRTIATWKKQIEVQRKKVAKVRDELNDAISEMAGLHECCERAEYDLQNARDALSELA